MYQIQSETMTGGGLSDCQENSPLKNRQNILGLMEFYLISFTISPKSHESLAVNQGSEAPWV